MRKRSISSHRSRDSSALKWIELPADMLSMCWKPRCNMRIRRVPYTEVFCDVADPAMGLAFASTLEHHESFTTINLAINFF